MSKTMHLCSLQKGTHVKGWLWQGSVASVSHKQQEMHSRYKRQRIPIVSVNGLKLLTSLASQTASLIHFYILTSVKIAQRGSSNGGMEQSCSTWMSTKE